MNEDLKFEPGFAAEVKVGKKIIADFEDTEIYSKFSEDGMIVLKIISKTAKKEIQIQFKKGNMKKLPAPVSAPVL